MVSRIWFLVTIRSNEMNKCFNFYEQDIGMFLVKKRQPKQLHKKSQVTFYRK